MKDVDCISSGIKATGLKKIRQDFTQIRFYGKVVYLK